MADNLKDILYSFVSNVIDCCDETIIANFINETNNTVNLESLLLSPLTKVSIIFQITWNALFKHTYPTKKDFHELVVALGGYQAILNNTIVNVRQILQACINLDAFTILKITNNVVQGMQAIEPRLQALYQQLTLSTVIELVTSKWLYRFCASANPEQENMLKTFVHLQRNYQKHSYELSFSNNSFQPVVDEFTQQEMKWMNQHEKAQYILYRNNRLLLHVIGHSLVVCHKTRPPKYILEAIQQGEKRHVSVIQVTNGEEGNVPNMLDHVLPYDIYVMLPKISQNIICINTPIEWQHPFDDTQQQIATYINIDEPCAYLTGEVSLPKPFKFCLTNQHQLANPLSHIYALPCGISSFNKQVFKWFLDNKCPFKTTNIKDNVVLYAHFLALYVHKMKKSYKHLCQQVAKDNKDADNVVLSVDTRFNVLTLFAVLSSYVQLQNNENWKMCIVTSKSAIPQYKKTFQKLTGIGDNLGHIIEFCDHSIINAENGNMFHLEIYNAILKDETIWTSLLAKGYKRCLIVQDDGMLMRDNGDLIKFCDYDYVGAPWLDAIGNQYIKQHINPDMVGNGGFSLRNIEKLQQVCQQCKKEKKMLFYHNINEIPEDVYFVQCLKKIGASLPSSELAKKFSVEQVFDPSVSPLGFHKFWMYHPASIAWRIFQDFLI